MIEPYHVLARRYRPQTFAEVVGQEFAVRALSRAMATGRIAHAYLLTGIHGVGKTSLARIIAKALCCDDGPTATPCGVCRHCVAITNDNHPDVTETDAASRTGVDDVREIVEGARYMPVAARYRIYIIDEAHMLSKNAFAALLKTLEEPPPEVVFILATTDPQRLPLTIVSRCQRYELRRVPVNVLTKHYLTIANALPYTIEDTAIDAIADAAGGSVRDGLSMLDRALALDEDGIITREMVLAMMGATDQARVLAVLEATLRGDAKTALCEFEDLHSRGADPQQLVQDLLDAVYKITRSNITGIVDPTIKLAAAALPGSWTWEELRRLLARAWGMLLKGCREVAEAPRPDHALAMLLVRLATVADLPTAEEVIRMLEHDRR